MIKSLIAGNLCLDVQQRQLAHGAGQAGPLLPRAQWIAATYPRKTRRYGLVEIAMGLGAHRTSNTIARTRSKPLCAVIECSADDSPQVIFFLLTSGSRQVIIRSRQCLYQRNSSAGTVDKHAPASASQGNIINRRQILMAGPVVESRVLLL